MSFKQLFNWGGLLLLAFLGMMALGRMISRPGPASKTPVEFDSEDRPGPLPRPEDVGIVLPPETPSAVNIQSRAAPKQEKRSNLKENAEDPIPRLEEQGIVVY